MHSSSQNAHAIIHTDSTCRHPHRPHMPSSTQIAHAIIHTGPSSSQTAHAVTRKDRHPHRPHMPSPTQTAHAVIHADRTCRHPHRPHIYYPNRPHLPSSTQNTHAVIHTDVMSLLQKVNTHTDSPDWRVTMFGDRLPRLVSMSCASHARVKGNVEVWRNWNRQYLRKQNQGHHNIDRFEDRGVERRIKRRTFSFKRTRMDRRQSDQR